jgi:hypothetical protein
VTKSNLAVHRGHPEAVYVPILTAALAGLAPAPYTADMSEPVRSDPPSPSGERSPRSLDELARLPADAPELDAVLPDWVTEAHRRYLETGEGDPWGGYFG